MSLNETIAAEIQKLAPSSMIELFEIDSTDLGGGIFRFHNGTNRLTQNLVWQGHEYVRFPIQVTGFEVSGQGQFSRPLVTVSNVMSAITIVLLQYGDLIGAKFTRKRTMLKYLDAVNFPGSVNPTADPTVYFSDDIFYVDRKSLENSDQVQFELASAADLQGAQAPKRTIIQSTCPWIYRGSDCGYTGVALYDQNDQVLPLPASVEALAMRAAYQAVLDAQAALATAQSALADRANELTDAQKYGTDTRYSTTAPLYYIKTSNYGTVAYWNNTLVSIGTDYSAGAFRQTIPSNGVSYNYYSIVKYSRNESAATTAQTAYDDAVATRDSAQDDVATAISSFDTAMAAVPVDDPVFTQDRCGKRLTSCKLRFNSITPNSPLNFGGFPGVSR